MDHFPTPYHDLNGVLAELVASIRAILGLDFIGAYLQGSFAIGDFDEHSDVDFIVAIERELTAEQVQALQVMHGRIYRLESYWAQHLEGSYFPREVLRRKTEPVQELWYLDNGSQALVRATHCNTLVVRWTTRQRGVTLAGPPPEALIDPGRPMNYDRKFTA
jgi:predicted nucleotidyltransferase